MDLLLEKSLHGAGLGKGDMEDRPGQGGRQAWTRWETGLDKVENRPGQGGRQAWTRWETGLYKGDMEERIGQG